MNRLVVVIDEEDEIMATVGTDVEETSKVCRSPPREAISQEQGQSLPSALSEQPHRPGLRLDFTSQKQPEANLAAYFATSTWRFPDSGSSSSSISQPSLPITSPSPGQNDDIGRSFADGSSANDSAPMPMGRQDLDILQQPVATELTDDDDFIDEADFSAWYVQQQEDENRRLSTASTGSQRPPRRRSSTILPRNLPISAPFESLDSFTHNGMRLAPSVYVELREGIFHEDFMKIVHIVRDRSTSEITLRGYIFRRTKEMNGVLDKKLNEVCWIIHIDDDDPRDPYLQGVETVPVTEVVKRRRVRLTNQSFPALSWRDDASQDTKEEVETKRVLVCRYQYLCFYPTAKARIANAWCEKGFHRLREDQCDKCSDNNMRDEELRRLWRGVTIPGGARKGWLPGEKEFLRQEGRSQKGLMGNQSLESPFGPNFPIGDPMKRGSVGPILKLRDLEAGFTASNNDWKPNAPFPTGITVDDGDADVEEMDTPPPTAQQRRRVHRKHRTAFAAFTEWPSDSSDYDSEDAKIMFALSRGKRPNSKRLKQKSPRTVEIDAQVKTSSSSGTFQRRYEGKITSIYIPSPLSERKRPAESSSDPPERPAKRRDLDLRADPERRDLSGENGTSRIEGHGRSLIASREISHFDTDHTLGLSQADTPNKSRGYRTNRANLLIPVSLRERGSLHPSVGPGSLSREARYSTIFSTQGSSKQKVENTVIDLTQTLYSASANDRDPCGSLAYQSNSHAWFGPQQTPSPNVYKASPSPRMSFRAASTKGNGYSFLQPTPTPERSPSRLRSPGVRPLPRTSSSKTSLHSPRAGSVTLSHRSSLTSSRTGAQVQVKSENTRPSSAKQRRYTFGDCFCGAGGMSRGAIDAGFRIEWGFDFNLPACQTYAMNFFATPIYNVWANEFAEGGGDHKVDICHLSPPCQFFSDAHTIMGKDDEMNTASLFAIFNLLEKAKPRIVTLEQTSGLIRRHPIFFNAVINMFTSRGFSVRWRVMNCADFGLPQRRMRLFIVASCPGEALPTFPKPTHSARPRKTGLKSWTTINSAIDTIPAGSANHDTSLTIQRDSSPQNGDKTATCITTSGGGIIHPSGKRDFTHREFACLQSLPLSHKFAGKGVKRQIGNMVPPVVATVLLEEVKRSLLMADGLL